MYAGIPGGARTHHIGRMGQENGQGKGNQENGRQGRHVGKSQVSNARDRTNQWYRQARQGQGNQAGNPAR